MEVSAQPNVKRILVIDKQKNWRVSAASSLRERGFLVRESDSYTYEAESAKVGGERPDLVIIGCASVKRAERELIAKILKDERHLLVFSASLPWGEMRAVFLAGVDDITDKTYDPDRLFTTVTDVFTNLESRSSFQLAKNKE